MEGGTVLIGFRPVLQIPVVLLLLLPLPYFVLVQCPWIAACRAVLPLSPAENCLKKWNKKAAALKS